VIGGQPKEHKNGGGGKHKSNTNPKREEIRSSPRQSIGTKPDVKRMGGAVKARPDPDFSIRRVNLGGSGEWVEGGKRVSKGGEAVQRSTT